MPKYNISRSALPPLEIEIEGVSYPVKELPRKIWKELRAIQARVSAGDSEAVFDQVPLLLDLPPEVEENLSFGQVIVLVKHVTEALYAPLTMLDVAEKKV
jgi:hypothetical protein